MSDRLNQQAAARLQGRPVTWSPERERELLPKVHRAIRRRRIQRRAAAASAVAAAVALFAFYPRSEVIELADGSLALPTSAETELVVARDGLELMELELHRGEARFEVVRGEPRRFRVHAGEVRVTTLGTIFVVSRGETQAFVHVERGRVEVAWADQHIELGAGEEGYFPPAIDEDVLESALDDAYASLEHDEEPDEPSAEPSPRHRRRRQWRRFAHNMQFRQAYELLRSTSVSNDVDELLLAADTARRSGHPRQALPYLERIERLHRNDPRAPPAAFTRGRILLQLGRPGRARRAFASARQLAPASPLAEDALAREVEAASRAGAHTAASRLARQYLQRYPNGRRVSDVRRFSQPR